MRKFAIYLLFQFKTIENNTINKRRVCEERIYHIESETPDIAYEKAKELGLQEEFSYIEDKVKINFDFIGIIDLVELSILEDDNLVWSRFVEKVNPMERKEKIIPLKENLTIFKKAKRKIKLH